MLKKHGLLALACAGAAAFVAFGAFGDALAAPSGWLNIDGNVQFAGGGGTVDWANSGPAGPACANGGLNITGSGGLFNCGAPRPGGLPPAAPQLTLAAASDPTIIGSAFIVDPIAGDSAGCGGNDPTILTGGGPKNGDAIGSYTVGSGSVPAKTELSNVYAVSHTKADGHPEVYFGAERLVNNGDSHMDFEFLQSTIGRTAACAGGFTGHRTQGDILVAVDFTNGGALAGFSVWQWHCAADPGPQPADGTVCDPTGVQHYEQVVAPVFASLTVNAATIPCGGWVCRDQVTANSTQIAQNDFLEGGVDLEAVPFAGCFHSFLPHTRTAQSFTSVLKDFAGPVSLNSCKDPATGSNSSPSGAGVAAGSTATDTVSVTNGGAGLPPAGTMTFYLCNPAQVTAGGCVSGGTQVGATKPIAGGAATSDPSPPLQFNGKYCWRTAYTPDPSLAGVYEPATHTNATTECLTVSGGVPLPNTGVPIATVRGLPWVAPIGLAVLPAFLLALAWRRTRGLAAIAVAAIVVGASPAPAASTTSANVLPSTAVAQQVESASLPPSPTSPALATVHAHDGAWHLIIPRIGVDARIDPVGIDATGAMAAPATLQSVGWFNRGPAPGAPGDAVIDGHFGLPSQPAVFRQLERLRPGDQIEVLWPNGRVTSFTVASSDVVAADARPADVFSSSGPARLTLITCSGRWDQGKATYTDRLLVTAMLS